MTASLARFLTYALLCLLVSRQPSPALAAESEARQRLESTINAVLAELGRPERNDPAKQQEIMDSVEKIILTLFDFGELSMRAVGPAWLTFSEDHKNRFQAAFTNLLRERYLEKLAGYDGETVTYLDESASKDGRRAEIQTSVDVKGTPVSVAYCMTRKDNWVVYDVVIERVSMVHYYRDQFQELLSKGDVEQLIRQVGDMAAKMRDLNRPRQAAQ
ncbi:MAG: ABC transporter substrate-binding protein [Desulfovibrio sp.]|jgi:ABC-type transporter MlaC component|nr:ABC transporter substrate-binding protein [Desulfovibrio sp.]